MLPLLLAALAVKPTLDHAPVITGNCNPARVHFAGRISSDGPGPVKYTWVRSDKPSTATFTLTFSKAESLPVTYDWLLTGASRRLGGAPRDLAGSSPYRQSTISSEMRQVIRRRIVRR